MHIIVVVLTIDDFALDIGLITTDLKLTRDKCVNYFLQAGCKCSTAKRAGHVSNNARLIAPIRFPKARKKRAKTSKSVQKLANARKS